MRYRSTVLLLVVAFLAGAAVSGRSTSHAQNGEGTGETTNPLVGSWVVNVTTGSTAAPASAWLMTFAADGSLLATTDGALLESEGVETTGHGAWVETGSQTADFVFATIGVDASGIFQGTSSWRGSLTLSSSADDWSSSLMRDDAAPDGRVYNQLLFPDGESPARATRVRVQTPNQTAPPEPGEPGYAPATPEDAAPGD